MQFNRFILRIATVLAVLIFTVHAAWAVEPFTVRDIRVEGLQRVEPGTIFASIAVRVGDTYSDEKGAAAIRSLFGLGLFKDVRLEVLADVLVVIVEERPTVADVEFVGTKEFDKDVLKKALRDVGLSDGRPFDKALVDRAEQELKRQYINRSLYAAEIVTTITPMERNRVNLTFTVAEGEVAKISEIRIVGNKVFEESTLRKLFDLDTGGGWLSWYTKSDRYSRTKLNADLETLRSHYLTRGYLEFRIESTQVAISPNKKDMSIAINIFEGERYVVTDVKLEGNYLGREEEFKSMVAILPGQPYNADQVTTTTKAFTDYFGKFGFAFARVEARPAIDRVTNRVSLVLQADPSRRVYVRRIDIAGNNRTRDEVVRREFRQLESSWYDGDKIKLSRDRVDRLAYFTDVNFETLDVSGAPDQVDLKLNVVEKPTGSVSIGAGYSSADGLGLMFGFSQANAFGSGNSLGLQVNTSKINRVVVLSTTDPYFTADGVSRSLNVYQRTSNPYLDIESYKLVTSGASINFGIPLTERDTVYVGAGVEGTEIVPGNNLPPAYQNYANQFGYNSATVPLTAGWSRDNRDSALVPTRGVFQRATAEWGVGGDVRYVRAGYQYQQYYPINKQFTGAFNGDIGVGKGLNGLAYPLFKNYYGGGLGSVRGFEQASLGPRSCRVAGVTSCDLTDIAQSLTVGGTKKINLNFELQAPFPGAGNDKTLRMYGFVDMGNVYGADEAIDFNKFRISSGVGISWISPMGPLRLAFAKPIRKFEGDRIQNMQFQIGTSF
ncbi:MAG: outer membrane protein assembly factor BamA [Burkholderiaceae bacterium]